MKKIIISSKKYNNVYAIIDDEDFEIVSRYKKWWVRVCKRSMYAYAKNIDGIGFIDMHRLIMKPHKNQIVDHINHNGLDNRKCNLRVCSQLENKRNVLRPTNNSSGYKGVHYRNGRNGGMLKNPWRVKIEVQGKNIYGGYFQNIKDAALKYNELALKHFGQFAYLNDVA